MSLFRGCPGATNIREVRPEDMACPQCGGDVEIWSDELTTRCRQCGAVVSREQAPSCIEWCHFAELCIGPEKYQRLKQDKTAGEDGS